MSEGKECNVELEFHPDGTGRVLLEGHDISNRISKVELIAEAGNRTNVVLHVHAASVKVLGSAWVSQKLLILGESKETQVTE